MKNVAVVPSNQSYSVEQSIQLLTGEEIVAEMQRQGANAKLFFRPGDYDGSNDNIPELHWMLDEAVKWLRGFPAETRYSVSNHSNSGITEVINIQPQLCQTADLAWGEKSGRDMALRVNGRYQFCRVRTLMYMTHMKPLGVNRAILHETGNHAGAVQAAYLLKYQRFIGCMIARDFLWSIGHPINDGPVPGDIVVPPGVVFDKYRPVVILPPVPPPPIVTLPRLEYIAGNLMRDKNTGDFQMSYKVTEYPVHWLQALLAHHTYKSGYLFKDRNGKQHDIRSLASDGWYGVITEGAQKHFEADPHFGLDGQRLPVDGVVDEGDWGKLRTV